MDELDTDSDFLDIEAEAQLAIANLLPEKSKKLYEKAYKDFKDWCMEKKVDDTITENLLLVYFTKKLNKLKGSTAWST